MKLAGSDRSVVSCLCRQSWEAGAAPLEHVQANSRASQTPSTLAPTLTALNRKGWKMEKHEWYPHITVNQDGIIIAFEDWAKNLQDKWVHVALTSEPGKAAKLFINGELQ